jgi:hypothetical protein
MCVKEKNLCDKIFQLKKSDMRHPATMGKRILIYENRNIAIKIS